MIFSSLKKNMEFCDKLKLFKCLDNCLKAQNINSSDPVSWNQVSKGGKNQIVRPYSNYITSFQNDEYDSLVNDLLQSMIVQDSSDKAKINLEILVILFHSVQVKMVRFLPHVISVMDSYVNIGASPDILRLVSVVSVINRLKFTINIQRERFNFFTDI